MILQGRLLRRKLTRQTDEDYWERKISEVPSVSLMHITITTVHSHNVVWSYTMLNRGTDNLRVPDGYFAYNIHLYNNTGIRYDEIWLPSTTRRRFDRHTNCFIGNDPRIAPIVTENQQSAKPPLSFVQLYGELPPQAANFAL
jgi:hypothetical protein